MSEKSTPPKPTVISGRDVDFIKIQLTEQHELLTKINKVLIGDREYGQKGIIEKVSDIEKYIQKDTNLKSKFIGGTAVVGVLWTLLLKFWDKVFH